MAFVDAYARVSDLQQLVATLPAAAPAESTPAPGAASFDARLNAALPAAQASAVAPQPEVALPAAQASAVAPQPEVAHEDGCCCCCCGGSETMPATPTQASAQIAAPVGPDPTGAAGQRALSIAEGQLGQAEQPPGSNDGPALATYRSAVAGSTAGAPWCAYFVSWASRQAGLPLGDAGQGLGSVSQITDWAQRTGRLLSPGTTPQPGDVILYGDRHVGLVESVEPDGSLTTVEGNYRNQVSRVHRSPAEATGFVRL